MLCTIHVLRTAYDIGSFFGTGAAGAILAVYFTIGDRNLEKDLACPYWFIFAEKHFCNRG